MPINEHYKEKLPYIKNNITIITDTYHTIHDDNNSCMTEHTITSKIQESMHRMVDHLKDKSNNINNYNNTATLLQKHDPWQNNRTQTTHNANKSS